MVRVKLTRMDKNFDLERLHPAREFAESATGNAVLADDTKPDHDLCSLLNHQSEVNQDRQLGPREAAPREKMCHHERSIS